MERDIFFKCMNCNTTFEINIGDFVNLKCPKCANKPTDEYLKIFKNAIKNFYSIETSKEAFGFDFQYPSKVIF